MSHVADTRSYPARIVPAKHADAPACWSSESGNDAQQRRFTGAVLAEKSVQTSRCETGTEIMQSCEPSEEFAYTFEIDSRFKL